MPSPGPSDVEDVLSFDGLADRHPGLTHDMAGCYVEAARVCLDRYHDTPTIRLRIDVDGEERACRLRWEPAGDDVRRAHANDIDAAETGAYAVASVCVEWALRLVIIGRAEHATGVDWYVAPPGCGLDADGVPDLDDPAVRLLEVSGQGLGSIGARVTIKSRQVAGSGLSLPGLTIVVGFQRGVVRIVSTGA